MKYLTTIFFSLLLLYHFAYIIGANAIKRNEYASSEEESLQQGRPFGSLEESRCQLSKNSWKCGHDVFGGLISIKSASGFAKKLHDRKMMTQRVVKQMHEQEYATDKYQMGTSRDSSNILINIQNLREQFIDFAPFFLPSQKCQRSFMLFDGKTSERNDLPVADSDKTVTSLSVVSDQCQKDVNAIYETFLVRESSANAQERRSIVPERWALTLFDSWGKHQDGWFTSNREKTGFQNECLGVDTAVVEGSDIVVESSNISFTGKMCYISPFYDPKQKGDFAGMLPLRYGTCVPNSCSETDVERALTNQVQSVYHNISEVYCNEANRDYSSQRDYWAGVAAACTALLLLPVVLCSFADLLLNTPPRIVKAFSAVENSRKIFAVRVNSPGEISCLHGMRVISICWIMLAHLYGYSLTFSINIFDMVELCQDWIVQVVWSGYRAVDTFFFISGLLVTKALMSRNFCVLPKKPSKPADPTLQSTAVPPTALEEGVPSCSKENGDQLTHVGKNNSQMRNDDNIDMNTDGENLGHPKTSLPYAHDFLLDSKALKEVASQSPVVTCITFLSNYALYIVNRFMRLTPSILFVTLFTAGLSNYFVYGPWAIRYYNEVLPTCRENWWIDATLFTNVIIHNRADQCIHHGNCDKDAASCLGQCWYLGVDFQLYLLAPFLLLPIKLVKRKIFYVCMLIFIAGVIPGSLIVANDYLAASYLTVDFLNYYKYFFNIYIMPYARAGPYFAGSLIALFLQFAEKAKKEGETPTWLKILSLKQTRVVGWMVCVALSLAIIFALIRINNYTVDPEDQDLGGFGNFLYGGFVFSLWGLCVGWVVLLCTLGLAGPVNRFLSHPFFQPLSRLSYMAFLVHVPILSMLNYSAYRNLFASHEYLFLTASGFFAITFFSSYILSLIAESPYISLHKIAVGK